MATRDAKMATPNPQAPPPFSTVHVNMPLATANRLMAVVHAALAGAAIAHRALLLLRGGATSRDAAMVAADVTLLFLWALSQAGLWRPVTRTAFPDRLLAARPRGELPAVDVLVVTADPDKEPALGVMNTVVSAMALDYAGGRLAVYLSDDAGSPLTLLAARRAYVFARAWVPFCRRYSVECPWPDKYFAGDDEHDGGGDRRGEAADERLRIKKMYETFKREIEDASKDESISRSWTKEKRQDHDAYVEIITAGEEHHDDVDEQKGEEAMPLLVYVCREKRRASPHHFKAGALNALLRVSSLVSNAPYALVLDCDMACNSRASALEAMCFLLDRSPPAPENLAFVQFPQMFHNLSRNDIYTNDLRYLFATRWFGQDGLRGPTLSGTGFYVRRDALYGATPTSQPDTDFLSMDAGELTRRFGHSGDLTASVRNLHLHTQPPTPIGSHPHRLPRDANLVATCAYEAGTGWGDEVGFMYGSVVEDYFTSYRRFFARGWTSAYCYPAAAPPPPARPRPPFLGSAPTSLKAVLVQNRRWMSGLLAVGLSWQHCPLVSRDLLAAASVPMAMAVSYNSFIALYAFPVLCYATLPQLCFLRGIPLFTSAGARWCAAAAFASSLVQHVVEVSVARRRRGMVVRAWWNEQRFWMLNAVTGQLFGCVGATALRFDVTSKAGDGDGGGGRLYQEGVFDFTGCSTLLLPATTLCVLNAAALVVGSWKMVVGGGVGVSSELVPQLVLMSYVAALSWPLLEGMFLRQDPARVPGPVTTLSVVLAAMMITMFG